MSEAPAAADPPRFTHDAFPTRRLDACVDFYTRFVGLRLVRLRGEAPERVVWLAPACADAPLFVFVETSGEAVLAEPRDPLLRHLGFELASRGGIDRLHARLSTAGLEVTDPEWVDEVVGYVTLVRDPDGRVVEFSHGQDVSPASWDASPGSTDLA